MKDTFHTFEKEFNKHKDTPNLEVEFRLGKKGNGIFDTNVGEDTFFKLKKALGQHDGWESVKDTTTDVYYGKNGMRLQVNSMTDEQQCELKKTISKTDHISADLPFDIRMSLATEIAVPPAEDEIYDAMKKKVRTSYTRKGLSIDMTMFSGNPEDMDDEEDMSYQVEFEIKNPKGVKTRDQLYNHIYKIKNLLGCL